MTRAQLDRFFHLIDQFSFEWDGIEEEYPQNKIYKEIGQKAQWIYDKIDSLRCEKMKDELK